MRVTVLTASAASGGGPAARGTTGGAPVRCRRIIARTVVDDGRDVLHPLADGRTGAPGAQHRYAALAGRVAHLVGPPVEEQLLSDRLDWDAAVVGAPGGVPHLCDGGLGRAAETPQLEVARMAPVRPRPARQWMMTLRCSRRSQRSSVWQMAAACATVGASRWGMWKRAGYAGNRKSSSAPSGSSSGGRCSQTTAPRGRAPSRRRGKSRGGGRRTCGNRETRATEQRGCAVRSGGAWMDDVRPRPSRLVRKIRRDGGRFGVATCRVPVRVAVMVPSAGPSVQSSARSEPLLVPWDLLEGPYHADLKDWL